jgi:hypothetical protein
MNPTGGAAAATDGQFTSQWFRPVADDGSELVAPAFHRVPPPGGPAFDCVPLLATAGYVPRVTQTRRSMQVRYGPPHPLIIAMKFGDVPKALALANHSDVLCPGPPGSPTILWHFTYHCRGGTPALARSPAWAPVLVALLMRHSWEILHAPALEVVSGQVTSPLENIVMYYMLHGGDEICQTISDKADTEPVGLNIVAVRAIAAQFEVSGSNRGITRAQHVYDMCSGIVSRTQNYQAERRASAIAVLDQYNILASLLLIVFGYADCVF